MTDNEIIKALECCTSWGCGTSCADCSLQNTGCIHFNKLGETLDLINRQREMLKEKSEKITIYRGCIEWQAKEINRQKAEIERFQAENKLFVVYKGQRGFGKVFFFRELEKQIKAEAIKEFAERLKKESIEICSRYDWAVEECTIDRILKEMVGDAE